MPAHQSRHNQEYEKTWIVEGVGHDLHAAAQVGDIAALTAAYASQTLLSPELGMRSLLILPI